MPILAYILIARMQRGLLLLGGKENNSNTITFSEILFGIMPLATMTPKKLEWTNNEQKQKRRTQSERVEEVENTPPKETVSLYWMPIQSMRRQNLKEEKQAEFFWVINHHYRVAFDFAYKQNVD